MNKFEQQLNSFFDRFNQYFDEEVPAIIAESANEHYRERFVKKDWDGKAWPALSKKYKPKRGTMMVRSANLLNSVRPTTVSKSMVIVSAGSSKVPYAQVHNEGGQISRAARSETFMRNRSKKGKFKRGTKDNVKGFSFSAYSYSMPQRQFMGHSAGLNQLITKRIISYTIS
jgi:phage gpG-like protein